MPTPEPTHKDIIELEVKRAISKEVEAYRKTLEGHQAYLEKSTKWFALVVSTLALIASGFFAYFFKGSVRDAVQETVDKSGVLDASKSQITNNISQFTSAQVKKSLEDIDKATTSHVEEIKDTRLRKQIEEALSNFPRNQLTNLIRSTPAGTIAAYGSTNINVEIGWLLCDGREVPKKRYPELYMAIGTTWGKSANADLFMLPDLRGVFLRGVNGNRTDEFADPDVAIRRNVAGGDGVANQVGSFQPDQLQNHRHNSAYEQIRDKSDPKDAIDKFDKGTSDTIYSHKIEKPTTPAGGAETRPKNAYVYYIIKY